MTDRELDERLAKALGHSYCVCDGGVGMMCDDTGGVDFSPSTSVDALRKG